MAILSKDYFRRDRHEGITAPDLRKDCTYAEHVVRARGKRTQLTSVSLDSSKLSDFGPVLYQAKRPELKNDGHALVEHADLISALREAALSSTKDEKVRAIQALRYATRRKEGLVTWKFDTAGVEAKDVIKHTVVNNTA